MRNTIILGSVRSSTSMITAMFRNSGAYFGDDIMAPTISNPYGYYECHKINRLNNRIVKIILYGQVPQKIQKILGYFKPPIHRDSRCSMLAVPKSIKAFNLSEEITNEMSYFVSNTPFCLKDPRFSITLPFWQPILPDDTRFLVVFRDPLRTVDSMLRNAKEIYNPPLPLDKEWSFYLWKTNYKRLLHEFANEKDWFFLHDELVFNSKAFPALEKFLETTLATDQINPKIRRSRPKQVESRDKLYYECKDLFEELKQRSKRDVENYLK